MFQSLALTHNYPTQGTKHYYVLSDSVEGDFCHFEDGFPANLFQS